MPEIFRVQGEFWTLVVWTRDNVLPLKTLAETLRKRGQELPETTIFFSPLCQCAFSLPIFSPEEKLDTKKLPRPLFFENKLYEFEFTFQSVVDSVPEPEILHRTTLITNSFHTSGKSLRGSINFGNDIGWFRLGIRYSVGNRSKDQFFAFQVFPTKMDMEEDLTTIHKMVDKIYPLWRFSFVQKTEQQLSSSRKPHERFPLLWLSFFQSLREELQKAVKIICSFPHSRLISKTRFVRSEKLKGFVPSQLEEKVTLQHQRGEHHKRYKISSYNLTVDTPENQFVKMVLTRCIQELKSFSKKACEENKTPENDRLSPAFFEELLLWSDQLKRSLAFPLFRQVGEFRGVFQESLVLHKQIGYSKIYRIWQELKMYLDCFGHSASISIKTVAELYEVWCLLEIRNILLDLGFIEKIIEKPVLRKNFFTKELIDGNGTAFFFSRRDGLKLKLAHEPIFSKPQNNQLEKIYSLTTTQKPDILLEATFPAGKQLRWIFDAKYRIKLDNEFNINGEDYIPDEALNQMHRYRDALILQALTDEGEPLKSRPIVGAFVLYPGWFDQIDEKNPYGSAIESVGIGGFPLLPGQANLWLRQFLTQRLGNVSSSETRVRVPDYDEHLLKSSVRIPPTGLSISQYQDLTLLASLGGKAGRTSDYFRKFEHGEAKWYHLPASTAENYYVSRSAIREIRYCAFAVHSLRSVGRQVQYLYDVRSVRLLQRKAITEEQSGREDLSNLNLYWLFELGNSQPVEPALFVPGVRNFRFRLTGATDILVSREWAELPDRYSFLFSE